MIRMRDKYVERYQQMGVRPDGPLRKRVPVPVAVPPWVLEKVRQAKQKGERVILHQMQIWYVVRPWGHGW